MRSSKKRSRSSQNRPRTLGNIINRVFDSSGPEGKVRGTPQQIIEKYQQLARDAQLSNDRVAAENFLQHAEHYTRMLAEAMREMAAEQEARQQQFQQNGGHATGQGGGNQQPRGERPDRGYDRDRPQQDRPHYDRNADRFQDRGDQRRPDRDLRDHPREERDRAPVTEPPLPDVIDLGGEESGLIETPEAKVRAGEPLAETAARAVEPAPRKESKPRGEGAPRRSVARRPKDGGKPGDEPPKEAAE